PKYTLQSRQTGNASLDLDIRGGEVVRSDGYQRYNRPIRLVSFQPHLHNRGKRECIEAIYPDGGREILNCAGFNFGWAIAYIYDDDVAPLFPAGTILHIINWHDNTAANRGNPDPRNWTGWGNRTIDEMSFAWISWYEMSDEQFAEELAARRALKG